MHANQSTKVVNVLPPAVIIDNAAGVTNVIDTIGFDTCTILVVLGALDIAASALKVQESDAVSSATALDTGADVTGLIFGTSADISGATSALPSATADNGVYAFEIDLKARKRYLDVAVTLGDGAAGTYCAILALLGRGENVGNTAAARGFANILRV